MCGKVGHIIDINNFANLDRKEEEGSILTNNMLKALNKQQVHVFRESQAQCIKIWQKYVFNLHKDFPTLEYHVFLF
jgi:hypothetical protein